MLMYMNTTNQLLEDALATTEANGFVVVEAADENIIEVTPYWECASEQALKNYAIICGVHAANRLSAGTIIVTWAYREDFVGQAPGARAPSLAPGLTPETSD